jgi:2'-5' RNA ligase
VGLIRSFIGIPPSQALRERIVRFCAGLDVPSPPGSLRWASPDNLHLTLVFLGATPEERVPVLRERLRPVVAALRPFRYVLRGPVAFPDAEHPRVLALMPQDPAPFAGWQAPIASVCRELGFALESRPFRPHLSLARTRRPPGCGLTADDEGLDGQAGQVLLYRSQAGSYTPLFALDCAA